MAHFFGQRFDLRISGGERVLSLQAGFEAAGQVKPLIRGRRGEAAERTDHALARALGGGHGLDQQVVGVAFSLVRLGGLSNVHRPLYRTR